MTCDARRRRAHVDVSRSAATACYVRLPPNPPTAISLSAQWTVLRDRRRTKGTEPTEADELHGSPLHQRRNAANDLHAGTLELQPMTSTAQHRAAVRAIGVRAAQTKTLPSAPKPMPLTPCTTQRRSPPDIKERCRGAAPRERRVLAASEDACFSAPALFRIRPHNAAVQRPRDHVSSAQQAHNAMARLLRARVDVSRSARTAC